MATSSFTGGEKLAAKLRELAAKASNPATLKVGFFSGATYPDGTSVPMVAAINEFGKPETGQPPRPFFRNMIQAKSPGWGDTLGKLLEANDMDATKALTVLGDGIKSQLVDSINEFTDPPDAPSTIARKGFASPLIDTEAMKQAVAAEVTTK